MKNNIKPILHQTLIFGFITLTLVLSKAWSQSPDINSSAPTVEFIIDGYNINGISLIQSNNLQEELKNVVLPYVGANKTIQDVFNAAEAVKKLYVSKGYPIVKVVAQDQIAKNGIIELNVVEGIVGVITVNGNKYFSVENIKKSLPVVQENNMYSSGEIVSALALANENPAKKVALNMKSGDDIGKIEAVIDVTDNKPQKVFATVENGGSKTAGVYRMGVGFQHNNLFDSDHSINISASSTEKPKASSSISFSYRIPFYERGFLFDINASSSKSDTKTISDNSEFKSISKGNTLGFRIVQPLTSSGEYRHKLIYGVDMRDNNNSCATDGTAQEKELVCGAIGEIPASLTYLGQYSAPALQLGGQVAFLRNIAGGPRGKKINYENAGKKVDWEVTRYSINLNIPIAQWRMAMNVNGQESNYSLISGERFSLGGANSVRGYASGTESGDKGVNGSFEFYTPNFGSVIAEKTNLSVLAFYDSGRVKNKNEVENRSLNSAGLGLRMGFADIISARLDFASAITEVHSTNEEVSRKKGRVTTHFSLYSEF